MDEIIFGNQTTFEQIVEFCEAEKFEKEKDRGRIGKKVTLVCSFSNWHYQY